MRKNFRLIAAVVIIATVNLGALAQEKTHKDVILDGQPAKLDLKTGKVKKVNEKAAEKKSQDSTKQKTEIQANLITNTSKQKTSLKSENVIVTSKPDTLAQYYKDKLRKDAVATDLTSKSNDSVSTKQTVMNDVILITPEETKDKATDIVVPTPASHTINKAYTSSTGNFHIVQKGETLYSLARLYDTTLGQLKQANRLETTLIKIGQELRVRNFAAVRQSGVWIVSKGDTLYSIAKKNNTTVSSLKELNGLSSDLIFPGQEIQF